MLYLILLLIFYPFLTASGIQLTYILKRGNEIHPSCIAEQLERYAAVGWIYPIPNEKNDLPNITTKYIPTIENDYNCKFSKNSLCNTRWILRDWKVDDNSPRTRDFISDRRWEDLPTILISNKTKEFKESIELDNTARTAFSVRADGMVEILLCSGWNPYNYPCHYFNIDYREIYYKTYAALPKRIGDDYRKTYLTNYKAYSNILSHDEWRNFIVNVDTKGVVRLIDVNLNRTLIEHTTKDTWTPLYMLMRSSNASLWKIHQNDFFYTNSSQISRLGPQLTLLSKDLCVSLFVRICSNCEIIFFYQTETYKKVLNRVGSTRDEWIEVKLKHENIQLEKINIFVETKFVDPARNTSGFWAIDDVRLCNENEVKVSFLKFKYIGNVSEDDVVCQLIQKPGWRPKKYTYDTIKEFPEIKILSNTTSLSLSWNQEDPLGLISYFISYQANDICTTEPHNLERLKSNGFVSTKLNQIVLEHLVPYTLYNITIATVLHEKIRMLRYNTAETVELSPEELPSKIQVRASDTMVEVSWEKVGCQHRYGTLLYTLIVTNPQLNFTKKLSEVTESSYQINGLEPYSQYTLKILTARNARYLHNKIHTNSIVLNFTTLAGVAPSVQHLELYSLDNTSASLRYELPEDPQGMVKEVQVRKCNSLWYNKCKSSITPLRPCSLWQGKYCVDVKNLISFQTYTFKVSIKNFNTHSFGVEASVEGYTFERVPGKPTNVTYRMVDCHVLTEYCHLNVTWLHPYYQNGTITSFNIILKNSEKVDDVEDDTYIHEIYKIVNKTYYPSYTYQIQYLPYSTSYNLYLQSTNSIFKSDFTKITLKTENIGDHIDQSPKLLTKTDLKLMFKIPHLDHRLEYYTLTAVVQDYNISVKVDNEVLKNKKIADNLCLDYGNTWISHVIKVTSNETDKIMIGNGEKHALKPQEKYCITFIITNMYRKSEHDVVYYEKLRMSGVAQPPDKSGSSSQFSHIYVLLVLLLVVIPIGFLVYRHLRKKRLMQNTVENAENEYESLPFDDCVTNENYDQLIHK